MKSQAGTVMENTMTGTRYGIQRLLQSFEMTVFFCCYAIFLYFNSSNLIFVLKIVSWTEKMVAKHPEMVSRIKIGSTVEDNPLYVLKVKFKK